MRGYCYLDLDGNVIYKPAEYIETRDPGFFTNNRHLIAKHWKFDTEDRSSMERLFRVFTDLELSVTAVNNFIKSIGLTPLQLKNNANKV